MPQASVQFLIEKAITASITAQNHGLYERRQLDNVKNFRKVPHCVYFYHVKFVNDEGEPRITWYHLDNGDDEIPYNDIQRYITPLAQNAHAGGHDPEPNGYGTHDMKWTRISYMVFL